MQKKINLGKKLSLNKKKLEGLNEDQLAHFMGGRMAATTTYTSGDGNCSEGVSSCCSLGTSSCCA